MTPNSTTPTTRTPTGRPLPPIPQRSSPPPDINNSAGSENTESLSAIVPEKKATAEMPRLSFLETSIGRPEISCNETDLKASSPPEYPPEAILSSPTVDSGAKEREPEIEKPLTEAYGAFQIQPEESPTTQADVARQETKVQRLSRRERSTQLVPNKLERKNPVQTTPPKDPPPPVPWSKELAITMADLGDVLDRPRARLTSQPRSVNLPKLPFKPKEYLPQSPTKTPADIARTPINNVVISPSLLRENNSLKSPREIIRRPKPVSTEDITISPSTIKTDLPVILESVTDSIPSDTNQPAADSEPVERKKND